MQKYFIPIIVVGDMMRRTRQAIYATSFNEHGFSMLITNPTPVMITDHLFEWSIGLLAWGIIGAMMSRQLFQPLRGMTDMWFLLQESSIHLFLGVWLLPLLIGGTLLVGVHLPTHEQIQLHAQGITLSRGLFQWTWVRQYKHQYIQNIRVALAEHRPHGAIMFDDVEPHGRRCPLVSQSVAQAPRIIGCGRGLRYDEATQIVTQMRDFFAYRCGQVEHILFGTLAVPEFFGDRPLSDPDVTTLTVPFIRLKTLVIEPKTADVHHLERFFTYALNTLGQRHVKASVEVFIYGAFEHLPPNHRNNLTSLFKTVHVRSR